MDKIRCSIIHLSEYIGHCIDDCSFNEQFKKQATITEKRISRTRTKKTCKNIEDILYENHITVSNSMKQDIDDYIKCNYSNRGVVDEYLVASSIFNGTIPYNSADNGHLSVLGYIIAKYCDVSHESIKSFLRKLQLEINNFDQFKYILNSKFSTSPFIKNDNVHFRKLSGYIV